jgi:hypothetical protein
MTQEAIRIPSAGAIFWAEADPGGSPVPRAIAGMPPAIQVTLAQGSIPADLRAIAAPAGLLLTGKPIRYDHTPTAADFAATPAIPAFTVSGLAMPTDGRFHPRLFSLSPTPAAPSFVPLRPSLDGTRITEAGAVILNLTWVIGTSAPIPASWAILQLSCQRNGASFGFSAQADINGDIIVPLTGLPPLTAPQTSDSMVFSALGDPSVSNQPNPADPVYANPDMFKAVHISLGGAYAASQTIAVARGQISTLASFTPAVPSFTLQPA